jgi:hypothetical protein
MSLFLTTPKKDSQIQAVTHVQPEVSSTSLHAQNASNSMLDKQVDDLWTELKNTLTAFACKKK